jgi:chondroitin AC lyase
MITIMRKLNHVRKILLVIFIFVGCLSYSQSLHEQMMESIRFSLHRVSVTVESGDPCIPGTSNPVDTASAELLESIQTDGSWIDIDYEDDLKANGWQPILHLQRLSILADAYSSSNSVYYNNFELYEAIVNGLNYYYSANPTSDNWWHIDIQAPRELGKILVLARGGTYQVPTLTESNILNRLDSITPLPNTYVGANRTDFALWYFYKGLLRDDANEVTYAVNEAYDELDLTTASGVQHDLSYQIHGPQLYFNGYGQTYINGLGNIIQHVKGTTYDMPNAKLDFYRNFVLGPYSQIIRGRYSSFNAYGRDIARPNVLKFSTSFYNMAMIVDPAYANEYQVIFDRVNGVTSPSNNVTAKNSYMYRSNFMAHNRTDYNFDVRANSYRINKTESGNGENLKGKFLSDGATNIQVNGDEYYNIFPVWDWSKIPGTTAPQYSGIELKPPNFGGPAGLGTSIFSGGATDGTYGVQVFDMNDYDTQAKKSWFLFDEEIVCLGAGISSSASELINTTINQSNLDGPVVVSQSGTPVTLSTGSYNYPTGVDWVMHDSIGYFIPNGGSLKLSNQPQSGSWYEISTPRCADMITKDVFKLWFDHGVSPSNDSYAYVIAPGKTTVQQMNNYNTSNVTIVQNDGFVQAVKHNGLDMMQVVFHSAGILNFGDITLTVNRACALILNNVSTATVSVSAADPSENLSSLKVSWSSSSISPMRDLQLSLPTSVALKGSTVQGTIALSSPIGNRLETFEDVNLPNFGAQTYSSSDNGFDWTVQNRETTGKINATKQIYMDGNGMIGVQSGTITGGIGSISVEVLDLWASGNERIVELLINGNVVETSTHTGTEVYAIMANNIKIEGDFTIGIRNASPFSPTGEANKIVVDNISWTGYTAPIALYPDYDAFVRNGSYSAINYGLVDLIEVKGADANYGREAFLQFDLSGISSGATLDSATLKMNLKSSYTDALNNSWDVSSVTNDSWTEGTITWNTKPASSSILDNQPGQEIGYVEWDVTSFVNSELSGDGIVSLKISSAISGGSPYTAFFSKENGDVANRPLLELSYASNSAKSASGKESVLAIDLNEETDNVWVYPNPVEFEFTVESKTPITQISIMDITGKTIKSMKDVKSTKLKVDVNELRQGIYFVRTTKANGSINIHKIIIK